MEIIAATAWGLVGICVGVAFGLAIGSLMTGVRFSILLQSFIDTITGRR